MHLCVESKSSFSSASVVYDAMVKEVYCGYFPDASPVKEMCSILLNKEVPDTCNTGGGTSKSRLQFEVKGEMDRAMLSIILIAKTTQSSVVVASKGTCDIYPSISDLAYIELI